MRTKSVTSYILLPCMGSIILLFSYHLAGTATEVRNASEANGSGTER